MDWHYERLKEDGSIISVYNLTNDLDGEYTGRYVLNVKAWLDENPEEAIARGWTKHITWSLEEIQEKWPHNTQSEYLLKSLKRVDEHTVEDTYYVIPKSEAMMTLEEMLQVIDRDGAITYNF